MITALKSYPTYKPSGVEWLGEVPKRWDTLPLKHWVTINAEVLPETTDPDRVFRYVDIGSVGTGSLTQKPQRLLFARAPSRARRIAHNGDTLVSTVRTYLKAIYFVQGEADEIVCSTGFAVLTPRVGTVPQFVSYLVRSNAFTDRVTADSVGTAYPAIAESRLGSFHVPSPPPPEQAAIVRFLDHANRRIRRCIRAKQKLITLLQEQKQAIIHQAVTGQIDVRTGQPYPAYKPSGVEWLGEVPEHWEVRRTRYIFREVDLRSTDGSEQHLSMSQSLGLVPSHLVENRTLVSESYAGGKLCRPGDLVLNRLKAHLGVFALASQPGVISPDYTVLRPKKEAKTEYFEQILRSPGFRRELRVRAKGIVEGFWRLYTDDLYDIRLPLPSEDEQRSIIGWIKSVSNRTKRSAASGSREIELLREYRTRLISDVVTGKLDVRDAAAELPEVDLLAEEDVDDTIDAEVDSNFEKPDVVREVTL